MALESIVDLLDHHEGFIPHAYQDHLGYWTIGIGRLIDKDRGGGITHTEALYLLGNDVAKCEAGLDKHLPWWRNMSPPRRMVVISMAFQMGLNGLLGFRKALAHMRRGAYEEAAGELLNSTWATQTPKRAQELAWMLRFDTYLRG